MLNYFACGKKLGDSLNGTNTIQSDTQNSTCTSKDNLMDLLYRFKTLQELLINDPKKRKIENIRFYLVLRSPLDSHTFNTFYTTLEKLGYKVYALTTNNTYRVCIIPYDMKIYRKSHDIYSPILIELRKKYLRP